MNNPKIPVILASQSPRRIELLKTVIENFRVVPSKIDEICDTDLSPEENAILLGRKKPLLSQNSIPIIWSLAQIPWSF